MNNKVSSGTLAKFLSGIEKDRYFKGSFLPLLSINGHSGGVSERLKHPDYAYRVYGKTGSLYYVNNLAGYLIGNSGKRYAFSIFTTHPKNREILNKKNSLETDLLRLQSKKWKVETSIIIDNQLKRWISLF